MKRQQKPIALFSRALLQVKKLYSGRHLSILIACMPKSGSTYLTKLLSKALSCELIFPAGGGDTGEHNLDYYSLIDFYGNRTVAHMHSRATERNIELINKFDIYTVVLTRNIFDIVISLYDHMHNISLRSFFYSIDEKRFHLLNSDEKFNFIIDYAVPWYFNFYITWVMAMESGTADPVWLSYEELVGDVTGSVAKILKHYNLNIDFTDIQASVEGVDSKMTRFNKGITGRGLAELDERQVDRIVSFTRYYPDIDFSRMGI